MLPARSLRFALPFAALVAASFVYAQQAATPKAATGGKAQYKKEHGKAKFSTKVGSFKILGAGTDPAEGRLEMSFTGTVLINGTPSITVEGNLKREYYEPKRNLQAYHGTGKLIIDGQYQAVQWFGRDMQATWEGFGVLRAYGEFDKDLNTGEFIYLDNPDEVIFWGTNGLILGLPRPVDPNRPTPRKRGT